MCHVLAGRLHAAIAQSEYMRWWEKCTSKSHETHQVGCNIHVLLWCELVIYGHWCSGWWDVHCLLTGVANWLDGCKGCACRRGSRCFAIGDGVGSRHWRICLQQPPSKRAWHEGLGTALQLRMPAEAAGPSWLSRFLYKVLKLIILSFVNCEEENSRTAELGNREPLTKDDR